MRSRTSLPFIAAVAWAISGQSGAQTTQSEPRLNPDNSVSVQSFTLPFSDYASPEARRDLSDLFERRARLNARDLQQQSAAVSNARDRTDRILFAPWLEQQRKRFDVDMKEAKLGGVGVQIFLPKEGIKPENRDRVLINLHGGGFLLGWPLVSQIESIPIASVGRIKVISVNYRMFPEARFPAASEDVAAVYKALLKTYKPSQIGIYGCSAGGILAGESIAWFEKTRLPIPAAIAMGSAALEPAFSGDSFHMAPSLGAFQVGSKASPYFTDADVTDPLAAPALSPRTLAKFPRTLLYTGSRALDRSATTHAHLQLLRAGADARLALWDGLDHCFQYNPDMPESQEAYSMLANFFSNAMNVAAR